MVESTALLKPYLVCQCAPVRFSIPSKLCLNMPTNAMANVAGKWQKAKLLRDVAASVERAIG